MTEHGRKPVPSKRLLDLLAESGAQGMTAGELAARIYGESTQKTRARVHGLLCHLRWNGHKIVGVKDEAYVAWRYVLGQFQISAKRLKHDG